MIHAQQVCVLFLAFVLTRCQGVKNKLSLHLYTTTCQERMKFGCCVVRNRNYFATSYLGNVTSQNWFVYSYTLRDWLRKKNTTTLRTSG